MPGAHAPCELDRLLALVVDEAAKVADADDADIYDALTASDRPYKKAMAPEKALEVLGDEARRGQIDAPLLRVFVEARVWHETARPG